MTLSKKRLAAITVCLTAIFFTLFLFLPESIVGHRADQLLLFLPKVLFLAVTAAITIAFLLIVIFKKDFMRWQLHSFNRYRYLLKLLVKRDFVTKYRKSVLGVLWSVLNPLLTMMVLTLVFAHIFRFEIENFPVYVLSGQLIFNFFSEATTQSMHSVIGSGGIIKKVYVPKYIFPLSKTLSSLVNVLFTLIAFLLVFIFTGAEFRWTMLLVPIPIFYTLIFSLGVGMFLSSLTVFFRDMTYLWGVFTMLLMFLTPIMYPIEQIPEAFRPVWGLNPLFQFVDYFRELTLHGNIPDLWTNIVCLGVALCALCVGTYVFMKKQDRYILYI
ncbi:MAG: ABC transporter permease [Oscillospiraceae bacterium]|nr:ABC transporter permease [Oscillospiraceae bacterium]